MPVFMQSEQLPCSLDRCLHSNNSLNRASVSSISKSILCVYVSFASLISTLHFRCRGAGRWDRNSAIGTELVYFVDESLLRVVPYRPPFAVFMFTHLTPFQV